MSRKNNRNTRRSNATGKRQRNSKATTALTRQLCAVTDPFCSHADSGVDPSGSSSHTLSYKSTGVTTITSGTDGAFIIFDPSAGSDCATILTSTSSTFPATASHNTTLTTFPSFVYEYRVVSAGIRTWFAGAATDQGGFMTVVPLDDGAEMIDGVTTTSITKYRAQACANLDIKKPLEYICRRTDSENVFLSAGAHDGGEPTGNAVFDGHGPSHEPVFIYLRAKASSDIVMFEWVIHYEVTVDMQQSAGLGHSRLENSLVASYQKNALHGVFTGIRDNVRHTLETAAGNFARYALTRGVSAAANYVLPGSGYAAAGAYQAIEYVS